MVREGPQEGPPEQGPGEKEAEQTGTQKSVGERRLSLREPVLCKSLCVTGLQNMAEGQGVMRT